MAPSSVRAGSTRSRRATELVPGSGAPSADSITVTIRERGFPPAFGARLHGRSACARHLSETATHARAPRTIGLTATRHQALLTHCFVPFGRELYYSNCVVLAFGFGEERLSSSQQFVLLQCTPAQSAATAGFPWGIGWGSVWGTSGSPPTSDPGSRPRVVRGYRNSSFAIGFSEKRSGRSRTGLRSRAAYPKQA